MIKQKTYIEWIIEFKICYILDKFNNTKNYKCRYIFRKGKNKNKRCDNNSITGLIYCHDHNSFAKPNESTIVISCKDFDVSYIKKLDYNFKYMSNYEIYRSPEIILTINHINVYVKSVIFSMNYYDKTIVHNFLFHLFNDDKIKIYNLL